APGALSRLRRAGGGGAVRAAAGPAYARVRPAGLCARPAVGEDGADAAVAGRLAHGRPDLRSGAVRAADTDPLRWVASDRDRRDLLPARPPLPDAGARPRHGPRRLGLGGRPPK